jgi:hypothetical protein
MTDPGKAPTDPSNINLPDTLLWLWDAPLFIDELQVGRFYDAVARPDALEGKTTITISEQSADKIAGKLGLQGKVEPGVMGELLTYFVKPSFTASGEGTIDSSNQSGKSRTTDRSPISTPERQLVQLTLHYLLTYGHRLFLVDNPAEQNWRTPDAIQALPRAVAFLNLPGAEEAHHLGLPKTKIIPTAAEFENGKLELIYEKLSARDGSTPPPYPDGSEAPAELRGKRKEYWQWFDQNFSATKAMVEVEQAATRNGRIRWIDYRLPLTQEGDTLHLHVCPAGKCDTGVFAYNFIKRGLKHGLRLVGTLKSEPDMNVLAIYEK